MVLLSAQRLAILPPRKTLSGYTERPPRPKGVKERRPDNDLAREAKAYTIAVSSNGLLDGSYRVVLKGGHVAQLLENAVGVRSWMDRHSGLVSTKREHDKRRYVGVLG
jgi:hypothetical protein